ncbi:hypothetical protein DFH06DRAFT_1197470 [Mycena polygramma]|nr:hypothetical protein DFH06DRAFT_1197470 [Mycena polygramma]
MEAIEESLTSLLHSNDAPHPLQTILVQGILRDKQAELSALGGEISRLERSLQTLRNKHSDLTAEMSRYSCILSPIRCLPLEIVGEIFLYFAPSMLPASDLPDSRVKLPWELGQVCCLWRAIALALPRLWSTVDTGPPLSRQLLPPRPSQLAQGPDDDEKAFTALPLQSTMVDSYCRSLLDAEGYDIEISLEYIQECLQRSGRHPLSLRLWKDHYATHPLLDILLPHSARWQEIVLVDADRRLLTRLTQGKGGLQRLRRIMFQGLRSRMTFANFTDAALVLKCAPNLTDLTFMKMDLPVRNHHDLPWSRITRYREYDCWWSGAEERFASYRRLTDVHVLCLEVRNLPAYRHLNPPMLFPNLRDASFRFTDTTDPFTDTTSTDASLSFLEMPALENLSFEYSGPGPFKLRSSIPRSSPCLKVLRVRAQLHYRSMAQGDLESAFELFPHLTEISIDVPNVISTADLARLIPYDGHLPLAPKLEIIRFSNKSFVHTRCEWRTLLGMLQARFKPTMRGITRLRHFEFSTDEWSNDENVVAGLKTLRRQNGWDIRVAEECKFPAWDELISGGA